MTLLGECAERFAGGEPALIARDDGAGAVVAIAAASVRAESLGRLYELGGDMIVLGLDDEIARRLELPELPGASLKRTGLSLVTPIDAADCITGGWSLRDRAHTIRVAADPRTGPSDLAVPGHVHPARIDPLERSGPAAGLELARTAGQSAAVALSAVLDRSGNAVSLADARRDPALRSLPSAPSGELRSLALARQLDRAAITCALPTRDGSFRAVGHASAPDGDVTVALIHGDPTNRRGALVHTHIACLLGDTFASLLCDCHAEFERAAEAIVGDRAGVILYFKPALDQPFSCPVGRAVDPSVAAGLLRHAGIASLTLTKPDPTLARELSAHGFELADSARIQA